MAGIILWIIAGVVFLATIIWFICDKNDCQSFIAGCGGFITCFLVFVGFAMYLSPNSQYYRQTVRPSVGDINDGYASIDSVGVINGITQYEVHWIGPQTGPREQ